MSGSNLWDQVLARIETKVNRHSFYTWFKPTSFVADGARQVIVRVPNAGLPGLADQALRGRASARRSPRSAARGAHRRVRDRGHAVARAADRARRHARGDRARRPTRRPRRSPASGGLNPRYTFDTLHRRVVEPVRARGVPRRRRGAVALVQPAVHLRRRGSRQDAPDARDRSLRARPRCRALKLTYISSERFMNEMINAVRYDRIARLPRALSQRRRPARRRHPVPRRQGRHADRVLPHVQRALRRAEADRPQQRLPAARDPGARGAAALAVRVGTDRRHPAAGSRDQGRDSQEEGRSRGGSAARQRRDLHRRQDQVEHPRARGIAHPAGRVRVADRPGDLAAARAGRAAATSSTHDEQGGHDRDHPEVRRRLLPAEGARPEVAQQLEVDRDAAPDRDVPLQVADARVAARRSAGASAASTTRRSSTPSARSRTCESATEISTA